jgi:hypothetical protein
MIGDTELGVMYWEDQGCAKIRTGLKGFVRHHVNILPGASVSKPVPDIQR